MYYIKGIWRKENASFHRLPFVSEVTLHYCREVLVSVQQFKSVSGSGVTTNGEIIFLYLLHLVYLFVSIHPSSCVTLT